MLVCVVTTGVQTISLDWLRLGSIPPEPALSLNPSFGLAPFTENFDATGSTDSDGEVSSPDGFEFNRLSSDYDTFAFITH